MTKERIHQAALLLFAEKGSSAITISQLAEVAGVARGTIYNNGLKPNSLFEDIANQLTYEMNARVIKTLGSEQDPALRLALGVRMFIRRAHEEPEWGKFICKFSFNSQLFLDLWTNKKSPLLDIAKGIEIHRYNIHRHHLSAAMVMVAGSVLSAIFLVVEAKKCWRVLGSELAESILTTFGLTKQEAFEITRKELPTLANV